MAFLQSVNSSLAKELAAIRLYVAYLADIFAEFNKLNLQLHGNDINLVKSILSIFGFIEKLLFYSRILVNFCLEELDTCPSDDMLLISIEHLKNDDYMKLRFMDLSAPDIPP